MTLPKLAVKRPVSMLMCVLMLLVFGINLLGDFLRDEFNPKLK